MAGWSPGREKYILNRTVGCGPGRGKYILNQIAGWGQGKEKDTLNRMGSCSYGKEKDRKMAESEHYVQALVELKETVARLRAEDGCPWDRRQTFESLKPTCVEEAAEVVSGINILTQTGRPDSLVEELGDLLLQVMMQTQIAEEQGLFSLRDVIEGVNEKMIRRHPHVFGERSLACIRKLIDRAGGLPEEKEEISNNTVQAASSHPGDGDKDRKIAADWKTIKSLEKRGREWEEPYLFEAFDEAEKLIGAARERKQKKE